VTVVVDASVVVGALVDSGADGKWSETLLASDSLAAPTQCFRAPRLSHAMAHDF
jgi:hypothetical protein